MVPVQVPSGWATQGNICSAPPVGRKSTIARGASGPQWMQGWVGKLALSGNDWVPSMQTN